MQELGKGQDMKDPEVGSNQSFARKMIKNYGDPDVKWEVSEQINLGLETRFFKDKLELNADFYQEIRHNVIELREVIPAHVGVGGFPRWIIWAKPARAVSTCQRKYSMPLVMIAGLS